MARNRHKKNIIDKVLEKAAVPKTKLVSSFGKSVRDVKTVDLKIRTRPVAWGFPMDELMFSKFYINMARVGYIMPWDAIITTESTYLPEARNEIHHSYIEEADDSITHLMMVDSDVLIPPDTLNILLSHKKPLVGGWYNHKVPTKLSGKLIYEPVVYNYINKENGILNYRRHQVPGKGLEKIDGLGAGCLLMRRDLAIALGERPYDLNSGGEDLKLCKQVYDLGFDIHVDWDLACAHVGVSYV